MQVAAVQFSAQKLFQSAWSNLRQSLTAEPAEAAQLRVRSREEVSRCGKAASGRQRERQARSRLGCL